jgi:putative oxidoreductase
MRPLLGNFSEGVYAIMRIVVGFLFACHGAQKLFGVFGGHQELHGLTLLGGIIEFVGGIMIAIGLAASLAAFIASGEMAFAYFRSHAPHGKLPIINHGELAVLYCFVFLYIAAHGSGRFSVDGGLFRGSSGRRNPR